MLYPQEIHVFALEKWPGDCVKFYGPQCWIATAQAQRNSTSVNGDDDDVHLNFFLYFQS